MYPLGFLAFQLTNCPTPEVIGRKLMKFNCSTWIQDRSLQFECNLEQELFRITGLGRNWGMCFVLSPDIGKSPLHPQPMGVTLNLLKWIF
jgi:hypothetical protein